MGNQGRPSKNTSAKALLISSMNTLAEGQADEAQESSKHGAVGRTDLATPCRVASNPKCVPTSWEVISVGHRAVGHLAVCSPR